MSAPDAVHVHSDGAPIVPGTSIAGVLRHRAARIAHTLAVQPDKAETMITQMFGDVTEGDKAKKEAPTQRASRIRCDEKPIKHTTEQIQARIRIDRLTGGVLPGYLFDEKPVWAEVGNVALWSLSCRLTEPDDAEIGLILQAVKDMWAGDLPVGGGGGIGRGVLRGRKATITRYIKQPEEAGSTSTWAIIATPTGITVEGDPHILDNWARAAFSHLRGAESVV